MAKKAELRRSFGGKTENFTDKQERNFEHKHLKAYLKGHTRFRNGINPILRTPNWYEVKEVWSKK